ncbi:hypothetical protein SAMN05421791_10152 [Facklamia miroungae]|uniref:Uncharacterized protein n=1 Tax=Facklamia miroungae TaxID=120956 RepID=A0A1G7NY02_9LACT|nr:hypothetical protein SAMN05421791_10152 [Facklamia miroungae]
MNCPACHIKMVNTKETKKTITYYCSVCNKVRCKRKENTKNGDSESKTSYPNVAL